ncbi:MAG TPA: hypothetical protein VLV54_08280 [Thermoanaerobaculia bacterium]|nr:hypothetical protein [Thermoanaerobaculia bacterium]
MATQPDFVLYDRYGRLAAVIEIKAKRGTSSRWAAEFRRNLLAYETFRYAPLFLLVTPDRLYLWKSEVPKDSEADLAPVFPDYAIDAKLVFERYLQGAGVRLEEISGPAFELIVMSWLEDLIHQWPEALRHTQLEGSGLDEAAKNGRITYPAAA